MNLFDADTRALYDGDIDTGQRNSLAALFDLVPRDADVLDVGIGSGALGRRLTSDKGCRVDGVTISADEAANAAPFYRRIDVADLDAVALDHVFAGQRYSAIICADVLEHLARPTAVLDACRRMLADNGVLLLSIPNVGYVGLLGELLDGEFRYRVEGLLDSTHLRFFTRRSLLRMLRETGWRVDHVETIRRELANSEFKLSFDRLTASVQRHLLAMPDALTYQFIVRADPRLTATSALDGSAQAGPQQPAATPAEPPHFSALLYLKDADGYAESRKLVAGGRIGDQRQVIRFEIAAQAHPLTGLRLDPADRPGFLHLFGLRLARPGGETIWHWNGDPAALARGASQQIVFRLPWLAQTGTAVLLTGDDPFFELPLGAEDLAACATGAWLEVDLGWPMSADYALFVDELTRSETRIVTLDAQVSRLTDECRALQARADQLGPAIEARRTAEQERDALAAERDAVTLEAGRLHEQVAVLGAELAVLRTESAALRAEVTSLGETGRALRERVTGLNATLERQRAAGDAQARQLDETQRRLQSIESSRAFRLVSPFMRRAAQAESRAATVPATTSRSAELTAEVDIIVPVYKGLAETRTCLESVLASHPMTPFRLLIVNDASPEPEITAYLRGLKQRDARVELLENAVNAGFVASVNRGMQAGADRDVVLLNSDTEVAGDWLDRLRAAAQRDARAATVTPFSNSATICSYPRFCADSPLPADTSTASLDRLFAQANDGQSIVIPTAVGFCMFIRRGCLDEIGLFDTERFGRGYGEENDFCMRAHKAGWRNLLAMDVFVHHAGGVSFGGEKGQRVQQAQEVLARLHPEYPALVHKHVSEDPARAARLAVDVARLRASGLPSVLCVLHASGGGTERHVRELAQSLRDRINVLTLRPAAGGETMLEWLATGEAFQLGFRLPDEYENLVTALRSLGVAHVHYHHLLGHSPSVWGLPKSLGVAHDFTAHDFYAACPQISLTDQSNRYCGEKGVEQCRGCLQRSPAPGGASIETWRAGFRPLLEHARYVLVPSADTGARLKRYFPDANVVHAPHLDMAASPPVPVVEPAGTERPLRVVVLGALSPIKGADVLETAAIEAARNQMSLEFHLLGFGYRSLQKQPKARLTVHGQYEEADLADLLAWLKPDVAWFPALWPETYSYTLSACLNAGLPIVAPRLGAFAERLDGRAWTWLCPWDWPGAEWAGFFARLRIEHFATATPPPKAVGPAIEEDRFSYRSDYLKGVQLPPLASALTHEFLRHHRAGRSGAVVSRQSKRALLSLAVRLRNASFLRELVRRVPLRWQTRVKVWLST